MMSKEWQKKHKLIKRYGITVDDWYRLYYKQNGLCAICHKPPLPPKPLYVDHDHKTNKVRGLLCQKCNAMLDMADDSIDTFLSAISYLNFHKEN